MEKINLGDFNLYVELLIDTLKSQDRTQVLSFRKEIETVVPHDRFTDILLTALFCLAEIDKETFFWTLYNYDPEFYIDIRVKTRAFAAGELVKMGFIPGKDFSGIPVGGLAIKRDARDQLAQNTSVFYNLLLEEILYVFN